MGLAMYILVIIGIPMILITILNYIEFSKGNYTPPNEIPNFKKRSEIR